MMRHLGTKLQVVIGIDGDCCSSLLQLFDDSSVVLGPVDGWCAEDGATNAALVVVVVGLATEAEVESLERGRLKLKKEISNQ